MSRNKKVMLGVLTAMSLLVAANARAAIYEIDSTRSSVIFKIQHFTGYTTGLFARFAAALELNDDNSKVISLSATVDTASVYTRNDQRDIDLQGPDLLDTIDFPTARFVSKKIEADKIIGNLTLKGKTKEVALSYTLGTVSPSQGGKAKVALSANGVINRRDFGIQYNRKLDGGKMLLGDQVEIHMEAEGILQK